MHLALLRYTNICLKISVIGGCNWEQVILRCLPKKSYGVTSTFHSHFSMGSHPKRLVQVDQSMHY